MGRDGSQGCKVHYVLALCSVQIYDVQAVHAQVLELLCHLKGVPIDLLRAVVALGEAHALAFDDVDCWNEFNHCSGS